MHQNYTHKSIYKRQSFAKPGLYYSILCSCHCWWRWWYTHILLILRVDKVVVDIEVLGNTTTVVCALDDVSSPP